MTFEKERELTMLIMDYAAVHFIHSYQFCKVQRDDPRYNEFLDRGAEMTLGLRDNIVKLFDSAATDGEDQAAALRRFVEEQSTLTRP